MLTNYNGIAITYDGVEVFTFMKRNESRLRKAGPQKETFSEKFYL